MFSQQKMRIYKCTINYVLNFKHSSQDKILFTFGSNNKYQINKYIFAFYTFAENS